MRGRSAIGVAVLASWFGTGYALADEACLAPTDPIRSEPVRLATVAAAPRTPFVKTGSDRTGCPATSVACQDRAYLVAGDLVLVTAQQNGFVCATFVSPRGIEHTGWLLAAGLRPVAPTADRPSDWAGAWTAGPEQNLVLKAKPGSAQISIEGDATYGAQDPNRLKNGSVHFGSIEAVVTPMNSTVAFTMDLDGKTLPYDKGDASDCRMRMRRLGSYLVVEDDGNCGGQNVSFSALYRRK